MGVPTVNIPPGKKVTWVAFSMCAWDKTVEILDPNNNVIATGYKKYDNVNLQQLHLKSGPWVFNSGKGGDFKVRITSKQGSNPQFITSQDIIKKQGQPYGTTFIVCTEDDTNIDTDYNDCTVAISWTNRQG